jgi:hypothetical protein
MSSYDCPNYPVCKNDLNIIDDENIESNVTSDNKTIIGCCKVKRDPVTGKRTLLELSVELDVCWSCKAAYNNEGDDQSNVYLSFIDSIECCICLKTERGVSFPHCEHYTCIGCHNRCWFGPSPVEIEFPYPDGIKQLYLSDITNPIWKKDPKMKEYIERHNNAENERMNQWEQESNLRKCPLCRK